MKILLVQPAVSPSKGGAQWNTARLAVGLAERGHTVRLIGEFHAVPDMAKILDRPEISIAPIRIHGKGILPILKLTNEIRKFKPDVVHSCLRSGDIAAGLSAFLLRKPVISTVGEKLPTDNDVRNGVGWKGGIHKLLIRRVFSSIVATSEFAKHNLINYSGIADSKVQIVPNGIDTELFDHQTNSADGSDSSEADTKTVKLGIVGRIAPEKRVELLPTLIELLVDRGIDATGSIVGEGISGDSVRNQVKNSPMSERITFLGNKDDMTSVYREFSVLVHFGAVEGFGLVLAEAMACGIPVVAANSGGSKEIINNGEDGFLVEPESIEQYADAIESLVKSKSEIRRISKNARKKIEQQFSINKFVDNYEALYEQVAGGTRA